MSGSGRLAWRAEVGGVPGEASRGSRSTLYLYTSMAAWQHGSSIGDAKRFAG